MNKRFWSLYAPIYEKAMRPDKTAYAKMYRRIPKVIEGKEVLEIATGPGLLAKHVAHTAKSMIATDYAEGMITQAKKGNYPENLRFEVADAFLEQNGFHIVNSKDIPARFTILYTECVKIKSEAADNVKGRRIIAVYPIPKSSVDWIKKHLKDRYPLEEAGKKYQEIVETYERFAADSPDIGGEANPMSRNFYGALSAFAYYECTGRNMTPKEITDMCTEMVIPDARVAPLAKLNLNNRLVRSILHGLFGMRAKKLNKHRADGSWNNTWGMKINPLNRREGISIHLVGCPIADFANKHGYADLMPHFCESDRVVMESFGGTLYREHTVAEGYEVCDYWIKNKGEY